MSTSAARTPAQPYATAIRAGDFIFISGQVPRDAARQVIGVTVEEQTAAVFTKIRAALQEQGAALGDVVKFQVFLADMGEWARFNDEYVRQVGVHRAARTTVGCSLNGVKVEIDATAFLPRG